MRKFNNTHKDAIRNYYAQRKLLFRDQKKIECLDMISVAILSSRHPKSVKIAGFTACAGTFWFSWGDGVTTTHNEQNWWRMKMVRQE